MAEDLVVNYANDIVVKVRHNRAVRLELTEQGPRGPEGPMGEITPEMLIIKTAAETARTGAEAAQTGAQAAKTDAETARSGAQLARTDAITAKNDAVTAKNDAQTANGSAQAAMTAANQAKIDAQAANTAAQDEKTAAVAARTGAETARTGAETAQTGAETARTGAEAAQTGAQTARTGAETARSDSQALKTTMDGLLVAAEAARDLAQQYAEDAANADPADIAYKTKPTPAAGTNLNTVLEQGVYLFTVAANVTTALNFPSTSRTGRLIVTANSGKIIQEYADDQTPNSWIRASANGGTTWASWAAIFNTSTLQVPAQAEAQAGSATANRIWTSQRVRDNVAAYASPLGHGHAISDITGLQAALDTKAPLASPALTGTPTAPTAPLGTNTNQIATMAAIKAALDNLVDAAPGALDTLNELAAALGDDPNFATTINNSLATKAPLASPALTGTPTAPTAVGATNNTQVATTAHVKLAIIAANLAAAVHAHSAADITSGTLSDARLPARLGTTASNLGAVDWNTVVTSGWFMSSGAHINTPNDSYAWWIGQVVAHNANYVTQTVWAFSSNNNVSDTRTYRRENDGGAWSAWQRVWQTEAELDARYALLAHVHTIASVTGLQAALDGKAASNNPTLTGTVTLPTASGTNQFKAGTGDNATYTSHNFVLKGHWGMGLASYNDVINGVYDFRSGIWDVKGGYRVNGQNVWHPGNFDPNAKATLGASVAFADITASRGNGTGVIYLNDAQNRYLHWDGGSYRLPGAGLDLGGALTASSVGVRGGGNSFFIEDRTQGGGKGWTLYSEDGNLKIAYFDGMAFTTHQELSQVGLLRATDIGVL